MSLWRAATRVVQRNRYNTLWRRGRGVQAAPSPSAGASVDAARAFLRDRLGIAALPGELHHNLPFDRARSMALALGEGVESRDPPGALCVDTGAYTGRSPHDRYIECRPGSVWERDIDWNEVNQPIAPEVFEALRSAVARHMGQRPRAFVYDGYVCSGASRLKVRVVTELAWHHAFVTNMFIPLGSRAEREAFGEPDFTIVNACRLRNPQYHQMGLHSDVFIALSLEKRLGLIGGTQYSGEMKKGIFTVMNAMLPQQGMLPLHCSATCSLDAEHPDTVCFAGLSGTGKSTLSADPHRLLIGDDEHVWDADAVRNMEGGIYVKVIHLSSQKEPLLWNAIREPQTILENVVVDEQGVVDFDDARKTPNTRASCPIQSIPNWEPSRRGPPPKAFVFLVCDAFGVLPPVAMLDEHQAAYHFTLAYTAKIAGTERGIREPTATFSTCFGAAFMPLPGHVYADLLRDKMRQHGTKVFLVNTGWAGGSASSGAPRMDIGVSRAIVDAITSDEIREEALQPPDPIFGLRVPRHVSGVDAHLLDPQQFWSDARAYETQARRLSQRMKDEFVRKGYSPSLLPGGPL